MAARYEALLKLASGGMASVWIGTARGALGFRQLVAIKKPHPHLLASPGFRDELIAEARLASMIRHANVVDVRDVEVEGDSLSLVMDFIEGASLGELLVAASRRTTDPRISPRVAVRILRDACAGLHAAHELVDERSRPVGLVHRDISPQNILVGEDGIARVTDFGVAKFTKKNSMRSTTDGSLKGKLAYMAPEYLRGEAIDRRFDVFATGVVLWEALTGKRCFRGDTDGETIQRVLDVTAPRVSTFDPRLAPLDGVIARALEKAPAARWESAAAMGTALEAAATAAGLLGSHTEVAAALHDLLGAKIEERRAEVRTKLAHEPSIASMGLGAAVMSPLAPSPSAAPTARAPTAEHAEGMPPATTRTEDDEVPATVTTEHGAPTLATAPAHANFATTAAPPTPTTAPNFAATAAPPTLATAPAPAPAPVPTAPAPVPTTAPANFAATLLSGPPPELPASQRAAEGTAASHAASFAVTLPVAAAAPARGGAGGPEPAPWPSARADEGLRTPSSATMDDPPPPPTRSLVPFALGATVVVLATVAALLVATRTAPARREGAPPSGASVSAGPSSPPTTALPLPAASTAPTSPRAELPPSGSLQ